MIQAHELQAEVAPLTLQLREFQGLQVQPVFSQPVYSPPSLHTLGRHTDTRQRQFDFCALNERRVTPGTQYAPRMLTPLYDLAPHNYSLVGTTHDSQEV